MNKNIPLKFFHLLLIVVISVLVGYAYGTNRIELSWKNYNPITEIRAKNPPKSQALDMSLFYDVLDRVNKNYYDKSKIDSQKLLYGAIGGMLQSLEDPYTSFYPPKENTSFKTQLAGEFTGIGAELGVNSENRVMIVSPLDGSPAQKAGLKTGDLIIGVNGEDTNGWSLANAVEKIRGPKGTQVSLSILQEKAQSPKELKITRDVIIVKSVTGWIKNIQCTASSCVEKDDCPTCATISYMRLSQFGDKTNDEWVAQVNSQFSQISQAKNFKGIILDLRNNPGGYLNDAVFIASEFLKEGVVVQQEDGSMSRKTMSVARNGLLLDYPLIVLINKGSASASEIVAGALRDYKRAKLLGDMSFGKGTIQEAVDITGGGSIHLSVAKWLTPKGTWVHQKGLTPDIKVTLDPNKKPTGEYDDQLQAAIKELLK